MLNLRNQMRIKGTTLELERKQKEKRKKEKEKEKGKYSHVEFQFGPKLFYVIIERGICAIIDFKPKLSSSFTPGRPKGMSSVLGCRLVAMLGTTHKFESLYLRLIIICKIQQF